MSTAARAPPSKIYSRRDTARAKVNRVQFKALTETDRPWRAIQDRRHVGTGREVAGERHFFGSVLFLYTFRLTRRWQKGVELTARAKLTTCQFERRGRRGRNGDEGGVGVGLGGLEKKKTERRTQSQIVTAEDQPSTQSQTGKGNVGVGKEDGGRGGESREELVLRRTSGFG